MSVQFKAIIGLVALFLLSGCSMPSFILGTSTVVGTAALQERGIDGAFDDTALRLAINDAWFKKSVEMYRRAHLMISQGHVVITGRVPTAEMKDIATEKAYFAGARSVTNDLTIGEDLPLMTRAADEWIASQLRFQLTIDRDVRGVNFALDVSDGVVTLLGISRSEGELRRVNYLAQTTAGVKRVKTYVQTLESSYASLEFFHKGGF